MKPGTVVTVADASVMPTNARDSARPLPDTAAMRLLPAAVAASSVLPAALMTTVTVSEAVTSGASDTPSCDTGKPLSYRNSARLLSALDVAVDTRLAAADAAPESAPKPLITNGTDNAVPLSVNLRRRLTTWVGNMTVMLSSSTPTSAAMPSLNASALVSALAFHCSGVIPPSEMEHFIGKSVTDTTTEPADTFMDSARPFATCW